MKVVILAGGYGSRISAETAHRPKPLIDVAGKPILHRVMDLFAAQGYDDFIIAAGYMGDQIKRYFYDAMHFGGDITLSPGRQQVDRLTGNDMESWRITIVDTGVGTSKIDRLRALRRYLDDEPFLMAHCDALTDLDFDELLTAHNERRPAVTVAAVRQPGRFGQLSLNNDDDDGLAARVTRFDEKPTEDDNWINGGFYVVEPTALDRIGVDAEDWEVDVLPNLADAGELTAFRHSGFWQCMDTPEDRRQLVAALARQEPITLSRREAAE